MDVTQAYIVRDTNDPSIYDGSYFTDLPLALAQCADRRANGDLAYVQTVLVAEHPA